MDRGLKAAFLFSLVVVAQADRALTAHKPSTGGLHAVAVLRSTVATTAVSTLALEATFTGVGNYMITNGNGTWTYSYYSNNGNLNGNDGGMGGDYVYSNVNPAIFNSNLIAGGMYPALAYNTFIVPSYDDSFTAGGVAAALQMQSPLSLYTVGITSLTFTGAKTGVAVGRFGGFNDYNDINFVPGTVGPVFTQIGQARLNILLTFDGATTFVRATGVPKNTRVPAAGFIAGTAGTAAGAGAAPPYPTQTPGDLTAVFMASKSLGWAVGGNDVSLAAACSTDSVLGPVGGVAGTPANSYAATIAGVQPQGMILMTQNGGSLWKYVPVWTGYTALNALWANNDPSLKNIFNTPIPGILFGIQSDASGKHVYAVGSGAVMYYKGATPNWAQISDNSAAITAVKINTFGTILYSGNSGMSWVHQVAPTLYSGLVYYALYDVAVQKGTTAVAVGGSPFTKYGDKAAGTIIYTMNGGFSWTQAVYPSSTGSKAPVFSCVSLQPAVSGVQAVWVGGFTTRTDQALAALSVGGLGAVAQATKAVDFYPVAAVAGFTPTGTGGSVSVVGAGVPRAKGQIYTILISKDGGRTFAAAPTAGLPTGFVVTSFTHRTTDSLVTDNSVYGITWDNAQHGWIYGYGYIMSTQNGGATWVYETPADVGVTSVTPKVTTLASVPTTY